MQFFCKNCQTTAQLQSDQCKILSAWSDKWDIAAMEEVWIGSNFFPPFILQFHPGSNVGLGKDYTIFSKIEGIVMYENAYRRGKKVGHRNSTPSADM